MTVGGAGLSAVSAGLAAELFDAKAERRKEFSRSCNGRLAVGVVGADCRPATLRAAVFRAAVFRAVPGTGAASRGGLDILETGRAAGTGLSSTTAAAVGTTSASSATSGVGVGDVAAVRDGSVGASMLPALVVLGLCGESWRLRVWRCVVFRAGSSFWSLSLVGRIAPIICCPRLSNCWANVGEFDLEDDLDLVRWADAVVENIIPESSRKATEPTAIL